MGREMEDPCSCHARAICYSQMLVKQPNRANVGSLWGTAKLLKGAPATQNA